MDCKRMFFCVLFSLLVVQTAHTDVIIKVFQNGKEGYNGCEDTHILVGDTADLSKTQVKQNLNKVPEVFYLKFTKFRDVIFDRRNK